MPPFPNNAAGRAVQMISPLGGLVGGVLPSLSLSRRRQKVELRAMANVHQVFLPVNHTAEKTSSLAFSEEDKHGIQFSNNDPIVISAKIMGILVHRLLVDKQ